MIVTRDAIRSLFMESHPTMAIAPIDRPAGGKSTPTAGSKNFLIVQKIMNTWAFYGRVDENEAQRRIFVSK